MNRQLLSLLSLCMRAGGMTLGDFSCEKAVTSGKAQLIIISVDASENTKKKYKQKTHYYGIPCREALTMEALGRAVGKEPRAVAAVTDKQFSPRILELLDRLQ